MIKKFVCGALCSAIALLPVTAFAGNAQLVGPSGKVMVDRGAGYEVVVGGLELNVGDQVFVGAEGAASLIYANGCTVSLTEASVATVAEKAPCGKNQAMVADAVITPTADVDDDSYAFPILPLILVGGGAAVVGTIILINDNNNSPASP
jgi:hypothetical protein